MSLPLFYAPDIEQSGRLPDDEAGHILRVLRMQAGDRLRLTDGRGSFFDAVIETADRKSCYVSVCGQESWQKPWRDRITIAIAPTKQSERMEWMLEKLVEIGVDEVVFIESEHSERRRIKAERLERIAISAMKQSLKASFPVIRVNIPIQTVIADTPKAAVRLIAYVDETVRSEIAQGRGYPSDFYHVGQDVLILIGPEGDFSPSEVESALLAGFAPVSLGESRLRTETAGLVACQWIHTLQACYRPATALANDVIV